MDKYYDLSKCNSDFLNKKEELLSNGWEIKEETVDFLFFKKYKKEAYSINLYEFILGFIFIIILSTITLSTLTLLFSSFLT